MYIGKINFQVKVGKKVLPKAKYALSIKGRIWGTVRVESEVLAQVSLVLKKKKFTSLRVTYHLKWVAPNVFYEKGVIANFAKSLSRCWILKSSLKKRLWCRYLLYI